MGEKWITVHLKEEVRKALLAMAHTDYRSPAQQLAWLTYREAEQRGLLHGNDDVQQSQGERVG